VIDNVVSFTVLYEKMAILLKITVSFLVCSTLICYGKDQLFDQSLEQIVTEEYWDALEEQDNEDAGAEIVCWFNKRILKVGAKLSNNCVCRKSGFIVCP